MPIIFDDNILYNRSAPQIVENAFRAYCNWSGLHRFSFSDRYRLDSTTVVSNANAWQTQMISALFPVSMLLQFDVDSPDGFGVRLCDTGTFAIEIHMQNNTVVVQEIADGSRTEVYQAPHKTYLRGHVEVGFREFRLSSDQLDVWNSMSVWVNNRLLFTYAKRVELVVPTDVQVGLLSYNGATTFNNVRVPQLTSYTEWSSLDPGEVPMGGLDRAMEGRYIRYFLRPTGEVRAWRADVKQPDYIFDTADEFEVSSESFDKRTIYTHVRMLGASVVAEAVDQALIKQYGHRFFEASNPYLMSESECRREAVEEIRRGLESALNEEIVTSYRPTLEPEDYIITPNGNRTINSISWAFIQTQVEQILNARLNTKGQS